MWDRENLYLAAKWADPTPMFSTVDPQFNPDKGWMADAWQLRVKTDRTMHVTTWFFTPRGEPCVSLSTKPDGGNPRLLRRLRGGEFESGMALAYRKDEDGKGFAQEMRIPWEFLYETKPEIAAGLTFRLGNEFLWGDVTGKGWPSHRYADNMQPGVTSREFYWTNWKAWGDLTLGATGNLEPRRYVVQAHRPRGAIPIRATVPAGAVKFTIALDDGRGRRVRNLAGDLLVQDYRVARASSGETVEVLWDGRDDAGEVVTPGTYRVVGLTHRGIGADYEMSYYNPGTPPWLTPDGGGAWGADHVPPRCVTSAGAWVGISWDGAEGGSGIIGIGPDGAKKWGEKRGAHFLAGNAKYLYGILTTGTFGGGAAVHRVCRYAVSDGGYRPFSRNGEELPFELPLRDLVPGEGEVRATALAANDEVIVIATTGGGVVVLDANTATHRRTLRVGKVEHLALDDAGTCVGVVDGAVERIDLSTGTTRPWRARGLETPGPLAIDSDGNLVAFDEGRDLQVKAFTPRGRLAYTCGRRGGRALRGQFEKQGLRPITSVAVDASGNVWTVERGSDPRRVSVWGRDGRLVRDLIGNTAYAGTGSYLAEHDPDAGYIGSLRFRLDRAKRSWELDEILWVPRPEKNEAFPLWSHPHHFSNPGFVESDASGRRRVYLYHNGQYSRYHAVYMRRGECWKPVAALCLYGEFRSQCPKLALSGARDKSVVIWNDANGDGAVQADECTVLDEKISLDAAWGHSPGADLSIFTRGMTRFSPVRFTADGAPVYGPEGIRRYDRKQSGCFAPVVEENLILCAGTNTYPNACEILGMDLDTGRVRWSYPNPYPGVHGSHRAPMPRPGLLIGPLKICGAADLGGDAGRVFMMRGNLGQDFYMTADGLFVGAMFRDGRLPVEQLPATEAELAGRPFDVYSHGSEPFSGWFGRQSDGVVRMLCGIARESVIVCRVTGLDTIRRLRPAARTVTASEIAAAREDNRRRAAGEREAKAYPIRRTDRDPLRSPDLWKTFPAMTAGREGSGESATMRLAYDRTNLYARFEVRDRSPWKNAGKDFTRLFKTGDCVDLHLGVVNRGPHDNPERGDMRIVFASHRGSPTAVLMQVVPHGPTKGRRVTYRTGWSRELGNVAVLRDAKVTVDTSREGYVLAAAIPLAALGIADPAGTTVLGDAGFISGDAAGAINVARTYWANDQTNLVSDEPMEAWLYPAKWGTFTFE